MIKGEWMDNKYYIIIIVHRLVLKLFSYLERHDSLASNALCYSVSYNLPLLFALRIVSNVLPQLN